MVTTSSPVPFTSNSTSTPSPLPFTANSTVRRVPDPVGLQTFTASRSSSASSPILVALSTSGVSPSPVAGSNMPEAVTGSSPPSSPSPTQVNAASITPTQADAASSNSQVPTSPTPTGSNPGSTPPPVQAPGSTSQPPPATQGSGPTSSPTSLPPASAPSAPSNSGPVHTIQSVTIITPTSTRTSTLPPVSTFSTPVAITAVQNGSTSLVTPAFVTILSTSTNTDGSAFTWTRVYANPTADSSAQQKSFFQNTGAVAGVFCALGIVVTLIVLCGAYFLRRHRRRQRQRRWLETASAWRYSDRTSPFNDDNGSPVMRTLSSETPSEVSRSRGVSLVADTSPQYLPRVPIPVETAPASRRSLVEGQAPFNGAHNRVDFPVSPFWPPTQRVHVPAETTNSAQLNRVSNPVGAAQPSTQRAYVKALTETCVSPQSSPSVYASSLPPIESESEDESTINEQPAKKEVTTPTRPVILIRPVSAGAPPRPPKSVLRTTSMKGLSPLYGFDQTSSPSSSTSSSTAGDSPRSGAQPFLARRTLLDVRPRSAPYSTNTQTSPRQLYQ